MLSKYNLHQPQSEEHNPILSLPKEILEMILNHIPQNETPNLRLVCKAWNNDVENLYNYEIKSFEEDSGHFQRILGLRIHKLSLSSLTLTSVLDSQGISIFKHPNTIRVLKIEEFPSNCLKNLQQLLTFGAKNLRVIHLDLSPQHLNYEFTLEEVLRGYKLINLKDLRITVCMDFEFQTVQENQKSLFQVLENSWMPQLKRLEIDVSPTSEMSLETKGRIGESILQILSRNGIGLEILHLNIFNDYGYESAQLEQLQLTLQKEELNRIQNMDRVQEFNLMFGPFTRQMKKFWQQLLSNQKELVTYEFSGLPISTHVCRQIIMNNCTTLVSIKICQLDILADDPPFDLSVFQACENLKLLLLKRSDVTRTEPDQPDVRQFHCLPESIAVLKLVKLQILSEEFLVGFTHGFKNLQELHFYKCGMRGLLGINWPVLSEILMTSKRSLDAASFSESVNCEDESLEMELGTQLGLTLEDLNVLIREPTSYFVKVGFLGKIRNILVDIARMIGLKLSRSEPEHCFDFNWVPLREVWDDSDSSDDDL